MRNKRLAILALLAGLMVSAGPVLAHHGTANYDTTKSVTVKGTVTDFQFTNPHVLVFLDVKDEAGKITKWSGELSSPNHLARIGWTKTSIKPGDEIALGGFRAKDGAPEIWIQKVTLSNGEDLPTRAGLQNPSPVTGL